MIQAGLSCPSASFWHDDDVIEDDIRARSWYIISSRFLHTQRTKYFTTELTCGSKLYVFLFPFENWEIPEKSLASSNVFFNFNNEMRYIMVDQGSRPFGLCVALTVSLVNFWHCIECFSHNAIFSLNGPNRVVFAVPWARITVDTILKLLKYHTWQEVVWQPWHVPHRK